MESDAFLRAYTSSDGGGEGCPWVNTHSSTRDVGLRATVDGGCKFGSKVALVSRGRECSQDTRIRGQLCNQVKDFFVTVHVNNLRLSCQPNEGASVDD